MNFLSLHELGTVRLIKPSAVIYDEGSAIGCLSFTDKEPTLRAGDLLKIRTRIQAQARGLWSLPFSGGA